MWLPKEDQYEADAYKTLDRAIVSLRYAFDGVDPDTACESRLVEAAKHIEQAMDLLKSPT